MKPSVHQIMFPGRYRVMARGLAAVTLLTAGTCFGAASGLRTTTLQLTFGEERHGALVSLIDRASAVEWVDAGAARDLFVLVCTRPGDMTGERLAFASHEAETVDYSITETQVRMTYRRLGGHDLTVTCIAVSADDVQGGILWSLSIRGSAPLVLEEIDYPIIELQPSAGVAGGADTVVAGLTKGGVYLDPIQWPKGQGISASQPGSLAAQFACYTRPRVGLLAYTRDGRGFPKSLDFRRTERGFHWLWKHRGGHVLQTPFTLGYTIYTGTFTAATAGTACSWRDGADVYKRWALTQPWCATPYGSRTDIPAWLKSGPGMIRFSREWLSKPERIETWLDAYWRQQFPGVPLIVALWGWERHGSWVSPDYFPPYPSAAAFSRVTAAIRRVGGHPFPWPSGYYWNVEYGKRADGTFAWNDWDSFNANGLPHALLQRDGSPLVRALPWLDGGRNAVLCRGDSWTREWFNQTSLKLMDLGCDMIQVDQVVGGAAPGNGLCYNPAHGHPLGAGVWDAEAFADQLRSLAATCRGAQSDAVIGIEEPQELYNHLVGVQDYRDTETKRWPQLPGMVRASVFGYLYHEYLPVFQSNPQRGDKLSLAHCLVTGQIPHWVPHWPVRPAPVTIMPSSA